MNVKKKTIFYIILFLCLISYVLANNITLTFIIYGVYDYLVPFIETSQNLVQNTNYTITVDVFETNIYSTALFYNNGATVTGNITSPSNNVTNLTFNNHYNGTYTTSFIFTENGTYIMWIKATNTSYGIGWNKGYIYVGQFPINSQIIKKIQFVGSDVESIRINVTDENNNPITGAIAIINITYPDGTFFAENANMTEYGEGEYYHTFVVPNILGNYSVQTYVQSASNSDTTSTTFEVISLGGTGGASSANFNPITINTSKVWQRNIDYPIQIKTLNPFGYYFSVDSMNVKIQNKYGDLITYSSNITEITTGHYTTLMKLDEKQLLDVYTLKVDVLHNQKMYSKTYEIVLEKEHYNFVQFIRAFVVDLYELLFKGEQRPNLVLETKDEIFSSWQELTNLLFKNRTE